ncbi:MAG: VWA domain-containing protein [Alistipes sp.]|jgi:Ca-activated chloride channel family protein|nr:VWA domain-containing protein [Alistipes sp.]
MFRFANPEFFWLLVALPLLAGVYAWSAYRRRRRLARFGNPTTIAVLMPDASPGRHFTKFVFTLAAFSLMVISLARPQLGSRLREETVRGIELMLAVDVSNSMLAEDFEPNRLERTKNAIERLLEGLQQDRVGLVVFAGEGFVQLPITTDYTTARAFVKQISPSMVSRQGTAIGAAIDLAVSGFSSESEGSRAIVLITDGENHEDDALAAAARAAERGGTLYTLGSGTPEGAPIRVGDDFLRDEAGEMVVSHLDEVTLRQIALATDGAYIRSTSQSVGLSEIITRIGETEQKEFRAQMFDQYDEHYRSFLAAALICILSGWAIRTRRNRLLSKLRI